MADDTSPEQERHDAELLRQRHPAATPEQLRVRLAVRLYGRDAAARLFGVVPDDAVLR